MDNSYNLYSWQVLSIATVLSMLGGIYSMLILIGAILIKVFSERLFVGSIIQKIYQLDLDWEKTHKLDGPKPKRQGKLGDLSPSKRWRPTIWDNLINQMVNGLDKIERNKLPEL